MKLQVSIVKKEDNLSIETLAAPAPYYKIYFLNFSDQWTAIELSLDNQAWHSMPETSRNCPYPSSEQNVDRCMAEGRATLILTQPCGQHVRLWMRFRNSAGQTGTTRDPWQYTTDCANFPGIVLYFG